MISFFESSIREKHSNMDNKRYRFGELLYVVRSFVTVTQETNKQERERDDTSARTLEIKSKQSLKMNGVCGQNLGQHTHTHTHEED